MESESAFIRANGGIVLDSESSVDLNFTVVGCPGNSELDGSFGLDYPVNYFLIFGFFVEEGDQSG